MNRKDICVGMKVVPFQKTVFLNNQLIDSFIWKRAKNKSQDYLFVTNINIFLNTVRLNDKKEDDKEGELFYPEDFELYKEQDNDKVIEEEMKKYFPSVIKTKEYNKLKKLIMTCIEKYK